jgi:hypothetical protein
VAFQYANVNSGGMSTHYHARSLKNDSNSNMQSNMQEKAETCFFLHIFKLIDGNSCEKKPGMDDTI